MNKSKYVLVFSMVAGMTLLLLGKATKKEEKLSQDTTTKVHNEVFAIPKLRRAAKVDKPPPEITSTRAQVMRGAELGDKVLRTAAEQAQYRELLSSEPVIHEACAILLNTTKAAEASEFEQTRMRAVQFLASAVAWKRNPARTSVIEKITEILDRSIEDLDVSITLKKSLIGDAIELFAIVNLSDVETANKVLARSSESQRAMFEFSRQEYNLFNEINLD